MTIGHNGGPAIENGWVAIHRKIRSHWIVGFGQPVKPMDPSRGAYSRSEAFIDLIMECRYEAGFIQNGGRKMEVKAGQLVGAVSYLAHRWNWTPQTVRTYLDKLENDGMIERQVPGSSENNKHVGKTSAVITVCNYDKFQIADRGEWQTEQQTNNKRATNEQQMNNNNNKDNKGTKEQEETKKPAARAPSGGEFWAKAMAPPEGSLADHNVKFENGKLELLNGFKADWLNRFGGDEERLDLAVTQAAAYVQPFGKPLDIQVSAQLARTLSQKLDRDKRAPSKRAPKQIPLEPGESFISVTQNFVEKIKRGEKPDGI